MKRRSKAGSEAGKARRRTAATPKRSFSPKAAPRRRPATIAQETETVRLARERDEALEREKATADVLRVISASPGDLKPVFEAILGNATRICEAKFGVLWLSDPEGFRCVALHGVPPAPRTGNGSRPRCQYQAGSAR